MLAYHLTSVPLTFVHIDGLKISTDKSTLFSELEVRIIKNAPRNVDACIVDGMFLVVSRRFAFNFWWSSKCESCRDHGLVWGEVNVSGPEQGYTKIFYSSIKVRII